MKKIEILTLFPEIFDGFLKSSLIHKAQERGLLHVHLLQIRDFADPPHYHVDDTPYGGGAGMVMRPEPLSRAIADAKSRLPQAPVILLSPAGQLFSQRQAGELSKVREMIMVCGRYEGVDQRVVDTLIDRQISIGDYILMGGEVAAMVVLEASLRLSENVLGNAASVLDESFSKHGASSKLLEAPHYTKPQDFQGLPVPEVLLTGNHAAIAKWRECAALELTRKQRPDLLK